MPSDPFGDIPEELRRLFASSGFPPGGMPFGFHTTNDGTPVDWQLATQVATNMIGEAGERPVVNPDLYVQAFQVAEQWLDQTELPEQTRFDPPRLYTATDWVSEATATLAPLIEPIAKATTDALAELTSDALEDIDVELLGDELSIPGIEALPPGFTEMLQEFLTHDPATLLAPAARALAGLQAGQVFGALAMRLLYQHEFTLPTASHTSGVLLAGNIHAAFEGYGLDMRDVAVAIALEEAAHRRIFAAVPWLHGHIVSLFEAFADGIAFDRQTLEQLSRDFVGEFDLSDADDLKAAMERASRFTMPPTATQERVIEQLHTVLGMVGAWARREATNVAAARIPGYATITEVLRRRLAAAGDGEEQLQSLLGLRLTPDDPTPAVAFIAAVEDTLGTAGLMRALAHPENLPTFTELSAPQLWLARIDSASVPDDVAGLFAGLGDAPVEPSAKQRLNPPNDPPNDDA